jgi:hypothetical protein
MALLLVRYVFLVSGFEFPVKNNSSQVQTHPPVRRSAIFRN